MNDPELDLFKDSISLISLALSAGWTLDTAKSSATTKVIRRGRDKVIVWKQDGRDLYRNERDHDDRGSVVDWVMKQEGLTLGRARQRLRDVMGRGDHHDSATSFSIPPAVSPVASDAGDSEGYRRKTAAAWNAASRIAAPTYLRSRGLLPATLADPRFLDTFRVDARGNVVFPHRDRIGLCGYELRRDGFKAFGAGTKKGLWLTRNTGTAEYVLVVESAIDAMSHFQLHGGDSAYCSLAGTPSNLQKDLLIGLMIKADIRGAAVYSAVDNDRAGHELNDLIQQLTPVRRDRLTPVAGDWNEDLKAARRNKQGTAPAMRRSAA